MPRGITQDQVNQAADAITATGERPTVERIRAHLGTGSPNTVTRMLEVWRQGLSERLRQASLLPELPEEVGQAMTALWTQALQHARTQAQQELQTEREALQYSAAELNARTTAQSAQLAAAEADRAKALEAAKLTAGRAEVQQQLIDRLQSELKAQEHEHERLVAQNRALHPGGREPIPCASGSDTTGSESRSQRIGGRPQAAPRRPARTTAADR